MFKALFGTKEKSGDAIQMRHEGIVNGAREKGKSMGALGMPRSEDLTDPVMDDLRAQYEGLGADHVRDMGDVKSLVSEDSQRIRQKADESKKKVEGLREEDRSLALERSGIQYKDYKRPNKRVMYAISVLLAIGDASVTRPALSVVFPQSNGMEVISMIVLTVLFLTVTYGLVSLFRKTQNDAQGWVMRIGALAVLTFCIIITANLRAVYVQNMSMSTLSDVKNVSGVPLRSWHYAALNLMFLFASALCVYLAGTDEEHAGQGNAERIDARRAEIEQEIRRREREIENAPDEIASAERRWYERHEDAAAVKRRLNSLFLEARAAYVSENLKYRKVSDGRPACFDIQPKSLF